MTSLRSLLITATAVLLSPLAHADFTASPSEAEAIAKEAYLYGFPVVEMYKTLYAQAVKTDGPDYKAPFNKVGNTARVFTPKDTAFVTPNSDTPYSFVWLDLRSEPQVLTMPAIEKNRYYSAQMIDLYTHNFDYLGTRTTGNQGGSFLVAGPGWKGSTPSGIAKTLKSEGDIVYVLIRTQLFDEKDLANVKKIQQGYAVQPLSSYLKKSAPVAAPGINWPHPQANMSETPALFRYLDFMLGFAQPVASEKALFERFNKIGVGPGEKFDEGKLSADQLAALQRGIDAGKAEFAEFKKAKIDTHQVESGDFFGTREHLKNNYLYRYVGANVGIFGNSSSEASYIGYFTDAQGSPVNAAQKTYTLHFNKGELPPAQAFWSLTMYDGKTKLLVENPINRYLINSRMLDQLRMDPDGGLTLYVQHESPGKDKESNWLPAPNGPFYGVLRIYMPTAKFSEGKWKLPMLIPAAK
ncbi:DUF1254 domain-containing protein [Pseudomonas koreensis]|uniref:DUF1254 domain-containing protein n=1 Tax=Pseudomonas koreensis TaxID=198620 RepID=UPI00157695D6|nr:DUF1254 domain-containing protein [Pseudomonas koreensis]NTZ96967.1 DUF1254 domain-containing protein [Pseudomonas koreensis]